ncbi:hypothetical protein ACFLQS_04590 [Actinomycetota bacterium]
MKIKKLFLTLLVVVIVSMVGMSAQCLGPGGISGSFNIKADEEEPQEESPAEEVADEEEPQEESPAEEVAGEEEEETDSEEDEGSVFGEATATEEMYQPILVYDFYENAPDASWEASGKIINWGQDWYAGQPWIETRSHQIFEDGTDYSRVLKTVMASNGCSISGIFPNLSHNITIPSGARFKAMVGFFQESSPEIAAGFRVRFYDGSNWYFFPGSSGLRCENDGIMDILDIDLSSISGKSGKIYLDVACEDYTTETRAGWVNPRIVQE